MRVISYTISVTPLPLDLIIEVLIDGKPLRPSRLDLVINVDHVSGSDKYTIQSPLCASIRGEDMKLLCRQFTEKGIAGVTTTYWFIIL